ncbi:hypothetical protein PFISCL1PPCAC_9830, partial [Pristionchus fissidentatus]
FFQMHLFLGLIALVGLASAQSCGETPIAPNLQTSAARPSVFIVGGTEAVPYSWPWAAVVCKYDWFGACDFHIGGSVIARDWVLTSASFLFGTNTSSYGLQTGVFNQFDQNEKYEQFVKISEIHIHPQFNQDTYKNDIALLKVAKDLRLDQATWPVCLPAKDDSTTKPGQSQWFAGWGYISATQSGDATAKLHQALLPIDDNSDCNSYYRDTLSSGQMCVGKPKTTTCNLDVGGPLMQQPKAGGIWHQYGVASRRSTQCENASVFTRVTSYCDWIASVTGIHCF